MGANITSSGVPLEASLAAQSDALRREYDDIQSAGRRVADPYDGIMVSSGIVTFATLPRQHPL